MNLGNLASGFASALTNASAGNQQGIAAGNQQNIGNLSDQLALYRQQATDAAAKQTQQANLLKIGAETKEADARTSALGMPKPAEYDIQKDPVSGEVYRIDKNSGKATRITLDDIPQGTQNPAPANPSGTAPGGTPLSGGALPNGLKLGVAPREPIVGSPDWIKAETAKAKIAAQFREPPPDQFTDVAKPGGAPGETVKAWVNPRTHEVTYTDVGAKTASGAGAQNAPQMAAAKSNIESAIGNMKQFEADLKTGKARYSPEDAALAAAASSPQANTASGIGGMVGSEISNNALAKLQKSNPDLWRYITNKKYVAEAILNTHKRPNQTQYEIEQELSGAGPTWEPTSPEYSKQIDMGADRRNRMYTEVFGGGTAAAPPARSGGSGLQLTRSPQTAQDPAGRWEQLVKGGMDKATATAQVKKEFPNP